MKEKGWEHQSTNSSQILEKCIIVIVAAETNSIAKSRSATLSIEFSETSSKPKMPAVMRRSIGKVVPASAPDPSGRMLILDRQFLNLDISVPLKSQNHNQLNACEILTNLVIFTRS